MGLKISVVLPCLNEEKNLSPLVEEIKKSIPTKYQAEIICVDDGSLDNTWGTIIKLSSKHKWVKGVRFHKTFGQQAALMAGIKEAKGQAIITMDADFQHPPKILPKLIKKWEKGHDLIQAKKKVDKTVSIFKKVGRDLGYLIWTKISDGILIPGVSDFRLMDKRVVEYLLKSGEDQVFIRGIVMLGAQNPSVINYKVGKRRSGTSADTFKKLVNLFITGFISFSIKPLRTASIFGILLITSSCLFLLYSLLNAVFLDRHIIEGWMTMVLFTLTLNGFIILYLGVLGEYIGILFKEIKDRPMYIIEEKINL